MPAPSLFASWDKRIREVRRPPSSKSVPRKGGFVVGDIVLDGLQAPIRCVLEPGYRVEEHRM